MKYKYCVVFFKNEDHFIVTDEEEARTLGMYVKFDDEQLAIEFCRKRNYEYFFGGTM